MLRKKRKRKTAIVREQWQFLSNFVDFHHFGGALQVDGCDFLRSAADGDSQSAAPVVSGQLTAGELAGQPKRRSDGAAAGLYTFFHKLQAQHSPNIHM